jgi:hypothetical protein
MKWSILFGAIFLLLVFILLVFYWFVPIRNLQFSFVEKDYNFSINGSIGMQFYENMRYPSNIITYKVENCPLQRQNDVGYALDILANKTVLSFSPVGAGEDISITCDEDVRIENGLFIAGEGGPVNITKTKLFNVILNGKVLLLKDSDCPSPNVAIHEFLHAFGFNHSGNKNNIMYPVSDCRQEISDDMIELIERLYETPTLPDLSFDNVTAEINGRFLESEITITNNGLRKSEKSSLLIYAGDKFVKSFELNEVGVGSGVKLSLSNLVISERNPETFKFEINSSFEELDKENNIVLLSAN